MSKPHDPLDDLHPAEKIPDPVDDLLHVRAKRMIHRLTGKRIRNNHSFRLVNERDEQVRDEIANSKLEHGPQDAL